MASLSVGEPAANINFGALTVCMFFAISGFLVTRSWVMTGNLQRYLVKRIVRIVPGFLAATFRACVLPRPFTAGDPADFLAQQKSLKRQSRAVSFAR